MRPLIQLEAVTRTYRTGDEVLTVLNNVNIAIEAGDFVAVVGPSGSGKSTLADVIGGLDSIDSGTVIVDGLDLGKARDSTVPLPQRAHRGFVFQSFNLQGSIVVTHDLDIARQASTVLSIQDGVVRQTQGAAGGVATQGATVG